MKLQSDATLVDVYPHLAGERRVFVANVRHKMDKARKDHGPVSVRIGITGNGSRPSFRIDRTGAAPIAYDANLRQFTDAELSESAWSTRSMSFEEVHDFLRRILDARSKATVA